MEKKGCTAFLKDIRVIYHKVLSISSIFLIIKTNNQQSPRNLDSVCFICLKKYKHLVKFPFLLSLGWYNFYWV